MTFRSPLGLLFSFFFFYLFYLGLLFSWSLGHSIKMKIEYFQTIRKRDFEENKKKMSDCLAYNHSVSFINKPWTFISAIKLKKDFTKVSRVGLLFDLNFHCNIGQFTQLLNFWLSFRLVLLWKWNNNYSETIQCKELLRKTAKTCKFMKKRYSKTN